MGAGSLNTACEAQFLVASDPGLPVAPMRSSEAPRQQRKPWLIGDMLELSNKHIACPASGKNQPRVFRIIA